MNVQRKLPKDVPNSNGQNVEIFQSREDDILYFKSVKGTLISVTEQKTITDATLSGDGTASSPLKVVGGGGGGGETLAATLLLGNTTGATDIVITDGQVIESPTGGWLNLADGGPKSVGLTTDGPSYQEGWVYLSATQSFIGYDTGYIEIDATGMRLFHTVLEAPYLTTALIDSGGVKTLITKEWYNAQPSTTSFTGLSDTPTTILAADANKFVRVNPTFTALEYVAGSAINVSEFNNDAGYLTSGSAFLPLAGGTMTGNIDMDGSTIQLSNEAGDIQSISTSAGNIIISSDAYQLQVTTDSGLDVTNGITSQSTISAQDNIIFGVNGKVLRYAEVGPGFTGDLGKITLTGNRTWNLPDATGVIALTADLHTALTLGGVASDTTDDTLDLAGQVLTVNLATITTDGAMSSTDKSKLDSVTVANIPTTDEKAALVGQGTPTGVNPYTTKTYVDGLVATGSIIKAAVDLATDAALPANTAAGAGVGKTLTADAVGILTVDGVATVFGDRILVKDETPTSDNGIYDVTTEGTAGVAYVLTRATDYDNTPLGEVDEGTTTYVLGSGTANAFTGWRMDSPDVVTIDTDPITFIQFQGLPTLSHAQDTDRGTTSTTWIVNSGGNTLTFGTTNLTASRLLEAPDLAGTIALTSDLSSYLPLVGGTMTGSIDLAAGEALQLLDDAYVNLSTDGFAGLQYQSGTNEAVLYNNKANGNVTLDFGTTGTGSARFEEGGVLKAEFDTTAGLAILDTLGYRFGITGATFTGTLVTTPITTSSKTWTLPDATGTVALTSDLNAYLPLAGGVMTGAVTMEKVTFSTVVEAAATGTSFVADLATSNVFDITMTGAYTLDYSNATIGTYVFHIKGAFTLTFAATKFEASGGIAPTHTADSVLTGYYDGTKMKLVHTDDFQSI